MPTAQPAIAKGCVTAPAPGKSIVTIGREADGGGAGDGDGDGDAPPPTIGHAAYAWLTTRPVESVNCM